MFDYHDMNEMLISDDNSNDLGLFRNAAAAVLVPLLLSFANSISLKFILL
jgi:hypothetical protein